MPALTNRPSMHPATSINVSGKFYGTNSTFANLPASATPCSRQYQNTSDWALNFTDNYTYSNCYGGAQNPSLLNLANGDLGVSYSTFTMNQTGCTQYSTAVVSRVGFQVSSDSGASFGPAQYLGNETCSYLQAIEPSFAVSNAGTVYGTFVQENATTRNNSLGLSLPTDYWNRTADALGFTRSTDNGTTFSPVTTLSAAGSADIARPQLATLGQSIYIVYDHFNNWTNLTLNQSRFYPFPSAHPIAVELIYSSDGGVTWNGPYTLPGLNGSAGYNSFSPVISVNSAGELAVAYATGRTCFYGFFGTCEVYGDAAVVATSTTNGTTWSAPAVLGIVGETHRMGYNNETSPHFWFDGYAYQFQTSPELAVAWSDTSATTLYAAWAGEYSYTGLFGISFGYSGVFTAASTNGGSTWTNGTAAAPTYGLFGTDEYNFDPALTVHAGRAYLTYTNENESYCFGVTCSPFAEHFSYWMSNSTNGTGWAPRTYLAEDPTLYSETQLAWVGYNDAIAYTSAGPVASFSQPQFFLSTFGSAVHTNANNSTAYEYWYNNTGQSDLTVALPWTGPTVAVNVSESGLPAGTPWSFNFTGYTFSSNVTTVVVHGVPVGQEMYYDVTTFVSAGFWARYAPLFGASGVVAFTTTGNITVTFALEYGIQLYLNPISIPQMYFNEYIGPTYFYWDHYGNNLNAYSEPFPWYVPKGSVVTFNTFSLNSAPLAPIAYTGFGNGSSTVVGSSTSMTVNGPINETIWFGVLGAYPVTFVPTGLPATSVYSFTFGGTVYSGNGTQAVTVANVSSGAHALSTIVANSSLAGWEYFGQASSGASVIVPNEIKVFLNFSAVDVGAPAGLVTFHANGLAVGDFWTIAFNGSQYGSSTPWINVTAHPGTYTVAAFPVPASANGTSAYTPLAFGPTLSVTPSTTYPVNFTTSYLVQVIAGAGGTVTGAGSHWFLPGSLTTSTAAPHPNYVFLGWTGSGTGSYTGSNLTATVTVNGPITESANFQALPVNRFNLTFVAAGLPAGTWWTVDLNGTGYSSNGPMLVVPNLLPCSAGTAGHYPLALPDAFLNGTSGTRFLPGGYPSSVCTTGSTSITVAFATEYLVTPLSAGGGTAYAVVSGTPVSSPVWVAGGSTVGLEELASLNVKFTGWLGTGSGAYTGSNPTDNIMPGGPVTETATFAAVVKPPPVTYELVVHSANTLAPGTSWSVTVDGTSFSSAGAYINISGLAPGVHALTFHTSLSPDRLTQYTPTTVQTSVTLSGNQSILVTFQTAFWVSESASPGGSLVGAFSGFEAAGHPLALDAMPAVGYDFVGWAGTGSGAYTGNNATASIVVNSPVTEVASFVSSTASSGGTGSSLAIGSPTVLVALAVVGLVVGLAVGYLLARRRGGDPGGST
jgi:Divergent InlB B-repeat domain